MMKFFLRYLYIVGVVVLAASCSSSRKLAKEPMVGGLTGTAYLEKVITLAPSWESVSGKVALNLSVGSGGDAKVNATLRLMRGKSIRLTVAPLLGIEVARLEITPQGILVLDRMNKRYVQLSFGEISRLTQTELDFNVLQSLFLNELFLPGKEKLDAADARAFSILSEGLQVWLEAKSSRMLAYRFRASTEQGLVQESRISLSGTPYALLWEYGDFHPLEGRSFPSHMLLTVQGVGTPLSLDMRFSRLSSGGTWEPYTEIPSRYKRIEVKELLKMLVKG